MITGVVYGLWNMDTNKFYVGQSIHVDKRFYSHKYDLMNQRHNNKYLQHAWNKSQFAFGILEDNISIDNLSERESYWIKLLDSLSTDNGYNIRLETDGVTYHSVETRTRISDKLKGKTKGRASWNKGKKLSSEHCKSLSVSHMGVGKGQPAWNKGIKASPEHKARISAGMTGRIVSQETRDKIGMANRRPCSQETRDKISIAKQGNKNNNHVGNNVSSNKE